MNLKALVAEFIGTFALVFVGVAAIAMNQIPGVASGLVGIALAHGLTIAVMATATGHISGGHFNPAVTFAALLTGKINALNAAGYVISQCLAGIAGCVVLKLAVPMPALVASGFGTPAPGANISLTMALMMEIVLTFILVFVIFGTAVDKRAPKAGGLYIGLAVALDILAGGPISGAAMNPARHLGPALFSGQTSLIWLYWVGPLIGGAAAGLVYHHLLEEKNA